MLLCRSGLHNEGTSRSATCRATHQTCVELSSEALKHNYLHSVNPTVKESGTCFNLSQRLFHQPSVTFATLDEKAAKFHAHVTCHLEPSIEATTRWVHGSRNALLTRDD
jgi:hypothetical protein